MEPPRRHRFKGRAAQPDGRPNRPVWRWVRWGGLAVCAAAALAWTATLAGSLRITTPTGDWLWVARGAVSWSHEWGWNGRWSAVASLNQGGPGSPTAQVLTRWASEWTPRYVRLTVPLWAIIAAAAVPTGLAWRRWAIVNAPGHCRGCGYEMAGLSLSARCPECGGR